MTEAEFNKINAFLKGLITEVEVEGEKVDNTKHCNEHGVAMEWSAQPSKKSGKHYLFHDSESGERCFGRGYMPKLS